MSSANQTSTVSTPRGTRARLSQQSTVRNRQLYDLIQLADIYRREGLLTNVDPAEKTYHEAAAKELSIIANITFHGAKKVLSLLGIRRNEKVWNYLKQSTMFCIFEESHFTKAYTSIKNGGGALCTDFLDAFAKGVEGNSTNEKCEKRRKLDAIAHQFDEKARDELVTMFFKTVRVVASLSSFMSAPDLDKDKISDFLQRYLSESWTAPSRQKQYNEQALRGDRKSFKVYLADGWHIVNEIFKIQAQELLYWKEKRIKDETGLKDKKRIPSVNVEDVKLNADKICHHVISEFFAWCYQLIMRQEEVSSFIDSLLDAVDLMHNKMRRELDITGEQDFPEVLLQSTLQDILDGGPTLAEIRYSAAAMLPSKRSAKSTRNIAWNREKVLMRCRWDGSSVKSAYISFLDTEAQGELSDAEEEVVDAGMVDQTGTVDAPSEEFVPGTPGTDNSTPNVLKRGFGDVSGTRPATPPHIMERRKRLKVSARDNAFRIRHNPAAERSRLETAAQISGFYMDDAEVSDDDTAPNQKQHMYHAGEKGEGRMDNRMLLANLNIHDFYRLAVDAPILPVTQQTRDCLRGKKLIERMSLCDILTGNDEWFDYYIRSKGSQLLPDVSDARNIEMYREHWNSFLPIEVRGMLVEEIGTLLPSLKEDISAKWTRDIPQEKFVTVVVDKVSPSRGLFDVTCKAVGRGINKRIAQELSGGTLCVAYMYSRQSDEHSDLMIVACRRVSCDEHEDPVSYGQEDYIEDLQLHLVVSRERTRRWGVFEGDAIHLFQLCAFSPFLRMFKSNEETYRIPNKVRNILCGPNYERPLTNDGEIRRMLDIGCAKYLRDVKNGGILNDSQERAMESVLGTMGDCEPESSSISMIHGPPGTGKTTMVSVLIGALLNHSKVGHLGHPQVNELKQFLKPDGLLRCSTNPSGLKMLVCSPSNQGVDNILQRISEKGIPDGQGGVLKPQSVRLARARYKYGALAMYSIDEKALPFDNYKFYPRAERKHASSKAQKAFGDECLVVYTTLSTSGSERLKQLRTWFDIVIIDEAAQTLEPESMIPVTTIMRRSLHNRCHVVFIGDDAQLRGMSRGHNLVRLAKLDQKLHYADQITSVFERLRARQRASCNMLLEQYRMHPCIAEMHSKIFYGGKVRSPLPASVFRDQFNEGWKPDVGGFSPFTMIDTSQIPDRFEVNDQRGSVTNCVELNVIDETLQEIKNLAGEQFHRLRGQIAVIIPYAAQVERAKRVLSAYGKYMEDGVSRQGYDILIGTLDSMQGAERDIIIFASTRSNRDENFGFLKVVNRLNVAVSRARKLLVVIADMSTLKASNEFTRMWDYCISACNGASLLQRRVTANGRATGIAELLVDKDHVCE